MRRIRASGLRAAGSSSFQSLWLWERRQTDGFLVCLFPSGQESSRLTSLKEKDQISSRDLPHQSKWTQNVSTLLREYFATFDHHHHGQPTHHPSVRLEILKHLTSAGGLLENTMNVREWHNDLLAVLIPVVSEIAMGERAKRGEASGERSRNYLTNITLFHSNSRLR